MIIHPPPFFHFVFAFRFALEAMMRVYDLACSYIRGILVSSGCDGDIFTVLFNGSSSDNAFLGFLACLISCHGLDV